MRAGSAESPQATSKAERLLQIRQRVERIGRLLGGEERINVVAVLEPVERGQVIAPVYDRSGRRINTPLQRARAQLFSERNELLLEAFALDPKFELPPGCLPPRVVRRVYFPVDRYPHVNFAGLVLGPRGVTQKRIEARFGCRLLIRGRGARSRDAGNDALHARIEAEGADAQQRVDACAKYLEEEILVPRKDEENALKIAQLRELAMMNGTLRDDAKIARLAVQRAQHTAIARRQETRTETDGLERDLDVFLKEIGANPEVDDVQGAVQPLVVGPPTAPDNTLVHASMVSFTRADSVAEPIPPDGPKASVQIPASKRTEHEPRKRRRSSLCEENATSTNHALC
ncbi:Splicing factor 1 [Cyanidiococcus yangmingshanensis]|uniref:Branchpoint-bridging protein n=1 Tax=Cyanidiococcus yangmingshanensis TaxID=2690220 RepID=A0A7J7II19_9RHOD|nr:Splicing factor 1 [Cyanidiococcus yangmingshanensis]